MSFLKLFLGRCKMQFWQTLRKFFQKKAQRVFAQNPKMIKNTKVHTFFKKMFFLKLFLWTSRKQFWQPLRQLFEKKAEMLLLKLRKDLKKHRFLKNMFFLKLFLWTCGMRFDNPSKKLEKKGQKVFAQCPKRIKSTYVLQKIVFPQTVLMDK